MPIFHPSRIRAVVGLTLGILSLALLGGCNATNDNPVSPDKMDEIRKKEADERAHFNPSATPPPAKTPTGK